MSTHLLYDLVVYGFFGRHTVFPTSRCPYVTLPSSCSWTLCTSAPSLPARIYILSPRIILISQPEITQPHILVPRESH